MVYRILLGRPLPRDYGKIVVREIIAISIAAFVVAPVTYLLLDREPPVHRLYGTLEPATVVRGSDARVRYVVTKRTRDESSCPGTIQQEIVDSSGTTFQKHARGTGPDRWEPDPESPDREVFYGRPVNVPDAARPGPATFRTITFRYCNWLQRQWPFRTWPIIQVGPDIHFMIQCRPIEREAVRSDGKRECVPRAISQ